MIFSKKNKNPLHNFIRKTFGVKPKNIRLYHKAFTHKSTSKTQHNERLEFLGDKVLSSVVASYLFKKYPKKTEGDLTILNSKIVSRKNLNKVAKKLQLEQHVKYVEHKNGHKNLLGNTLEAIIGAIYLDHSYEKAQKVIIKILLKKHISIPYLDEKNEDFKSQLAIWSQRNNTDITYHTVGLHANKAFKSSILLSDNQIASAEGNTKKQAEQKASKKALEKLNK